MKCPQETTHTAAIECSVRKRVMQQSMDYIETHHHKKIIYRLFAPVFVITAEWNFVTHFEF